MTSKLTGPMVIIIKKLLYGGELTLAQIGSIFNVSRATIGEIKNNNRWNLI